MKILTLEDELEINDFYKNLLKEFEHEVFTTYTSQEAIDIVQKNQIGLAIIDHRLSLSGSGLSGLETISELKKIRPEMRIIMISANYPPHLEKNYKEHGIDLLIKKPFHIDDIISHVKHFTSDSF